MTGTIINVIAILIGGTLGTLLGSRLPDRIRQTVMAAMGLFVLAIGLQMFLETANSLVVLASLVIGVILGEWWQIEEGIRRMGRTLERRVMPQNGTEEEHLARQERFVRGFFTASLLFCVGPIAILGSIQDGLDGNYQLLAVKSVLDGFASVAFASSLGVGVLFSALPILLYQGAISLAATQIQPFFSNPMMVEMTATGGILLVAIAVSSLLELKPIRTGNLLPALIVAPLLVAALTALGINWALLP
jgi:uncharacterized membrane protein YqgA involved in biofilm formation